MVKLFYMDISFVMTFIVCNNRFDVNYETSKKILLKYYSHLIKHYLLGSLVALQSKKVK